MRAIYDGVDLMGLTTTHEFDIRPVYDDSQSDYLYSKVTLLDEFLINPQLTVVNGPPASYMLGVPPQPFTRPPSQNIEELRTKPGAGDGLKLVGEVINEKTIRNPPRFVKGPIPDGGEGLAVGDTVGEIAQIAIVPNAPAFTLRDIRHRLSTHQGKLYIFNGPGMESGSPIASTSDPPLFAQIIVSSPLDGAECDCNNGPKPQLLSIRQDEGDGGSFIALWGVETYINEADRNGVAPISALLSNRFSQTHSVDKYGWSSIRTQGTAIFRTDMVYAVPTSPDSLRASMFLPIPLGFEREIEYVRGNESVNALEYAYTDTQKKTNFVAGPFVNPDIPGTGAAEITIVHRQSLTSNADVLGGAMNAYERILGIRANKSIAKDEKPTDDAKAMQKLARMIGRNISKGMKSKAKKATPPPGP